MLNSLRDGQINYGTSNCPSAHVPPHNVVTPLHQNSLMSTETTTPVVYPWNSNPRLEHLYGFHSRYYNLDFPTPYSPAANQYVPTNMYGQNVPQCCQPCCRLRSQNIPKTSPQVLHNPIRPVQQVNRSYKSKKTLKTPCSEQFLPYITNDVPVQYDTQNSYQQKYSSSYLNSANYCPPSNNNLWVPPAANSTWSSADRLRPLGHHTGITPDFSRDKNYQRLPNYQNNSYSSSTAGATHHRPYNYNLPIPDVHDYRPPVYHNQLRTSTSEYVSSEHNSRLPIPSQNNQSQPSVQQYYNTQPVPYSEVQRPSEPFRTHVTSQSSSKSNLNVREFLANWDEGEEESSEKSSETTAPIVVLDCMTLEGEALTKIQEKLNVVSYENLEKVLKDNQSPLVINTESNETDSIHNKTKPPVKPNFEPLDYTKRETGIIKPFITEKKSVPEVNSRPDKSYSVNFDGMVTWYGKKTTDISSTDLIEKLADRIFNLSKSQENEGVSFGTAAYTGQITQTNRSVESLMKDPAKYVQSPHMYNLQNHPVKCIEPSVINKNDCKNDSVSRTHCCVSNENNKASTVKSNNTNTSCIVENVSKKCLNMSNSNEETTLWNLNHGSQDQHLNMSLYDHSVVTKPLDFSSLTDENKGNPFAFEKHLPSNDKPVCNINNQYNKVLNENNNYSSAVSDNQHSIQQIDSSNRNFPVIVSPHIQRHEYNVFHESVIQRTGCDKNKHEKVSTQPDFENMNWNLSNDLDKIMKNTNIAPIEPPCSYDRNNFGILDSMNSNKTVPTPWKDTVPCVDLTVNSKTNPNNDSFFDGWNFIDSYEHLSSKKVTNPTSSSSSEVHNPLFFNQVSSLEELSNRNNNSINKKVENEAMVTLKDVSYAKPSDLSYNSIRSRDVFNLNSRIPDFSDGFELTTPNELHEYMQFKKSSNDIEHRTDGSIFEHLTEPKCVKNVKESVNAKNEQIKSDIVGLPIFKEKDPLAPMSVPSKLNVVKPIIRDPNQIFTVIKQKSKHDNTNNACVDNDSVVSNKAGLYLRGNQTFNGTDLKPKYNNGQLSQFDVWSEKFVLNGNTNNSASSVVQCDVEITQFKSTSENCNSLTSKSNINENYLNKNTLRPENVCADKLNINENDKLNSNDFLHCLDCSKTDSQKYRDPLDEFETSFGFDMHCNNESNKSFHETIVDKCLEERIKDHIGEHNMNTSGSTHTMTSNNSNTQFPFQCDFQSSYLIKNYFDENKNKPIILEQDRTSNDGKLNTTSFNLNSAIEHSFELQNDKNIDTIQNSRKKLDFTIMNEMNHNFEEQIKNNIKDEHSNCLTQTNLKLPFPSNHENINTSEMITKEKNNFNYLTVEDRNFEFKNNESIETHKHNETTDACKTNFSNESNKNQNLSDVQKHPTNMIVGFELNENSSNIFETNESTITKNITSNYKNRELENTKNTIESTLCSQNLENNVHQIKSKNSFELKNDNNNLYQTHNLEKIPELDFETRIIHNFEMECSNNIQEAVSYKKEIFTNSNQTSAEHGDKVNDKEYKNQEELKNSLDILEKPLTEKTSKSACNTQPRDINKTNDEKQENELNNFFEVDCLTSDNEKILNSDSDLKVRNKNPENINPNNSHTRANCNVDVENIFEDLYDNLNILKDEKVKSGPVDSCSQNDDKHDLSKIPENIKNQNLKINNFENIEKCEDTQVVKSCSESDKTFDVNDHVLLDDFVKLSTSHSETGSSPQKPLVDKTIGEKLKSDKYNTNLLDENLPNNENFLNFSDKNAHCQKNMQLLKSTKVEYSTKKEIVEGTNVFDDALMKQKTQALKQDISSVNPVEITVHENLNKSNDTNDSISSSTNTVELINQQISNEMIDHENFTSSRHSSAGLDELPNNQCSHKLETVENIIGSKNSSTDVDKSTCHQHSNKIIIGENETNSSHISRDIDKSTCNERSDINIDINDKTNFEHGPLYHLKLKEQQDTISDVKNTRSSNTDELACENSNEIVNTEDTNTVSGLLNHNSITKQQNFNTSDEIKNEMNLKPSLLNVDESSRDHDSNEIIDVEDTTDFEPDLSSNSELLKKPRSNEIVADVDKVENVSSSETSSFDISKTTCNQGSSEITDVENKTYSETSLLNVSIKTSHSQDSNEIVDVENNFESNVYNDAELPNQHRSNNILKIEDTYNCSKPSTESNLELVNFRDFNKEVNSEDTTHFKLGTLNNIESHNELHSNKIAKVEDNYGSSTLHFVESTCQKSNKIISIDKTPDLISTTLNKIELFDQPRSQNSTEDVKIEYLTNPLPSSFEVDEITSHQNSDEKLDTEYTTHYKSSTSHNLETYDRQHTDKVVEVECATNSVSIQLNANDLACDKKSIEVDDATDFKLRSSSIEELSKDLSLNKFVKVKETTISGSSPLNVDELIHHQTHNEVIGVDDDETQFGFNSLNNVEPTKRDILNKTIETENADDLELRSFKAAVEFSEKQNCHQRFNEKDSESASLEKSTLIDNNNSSKIESDFGHENTDSKSAGDIKLPRVKFFLKCSKSVIRNNVFDEEPSSCKKPNVVRDIKLVAGSIFKKRNNIFKIWSNLPKKMSPDDPKNDVNKVVETIHTQVTSTVVRNLDNLQQTNGDLVSQSAEVTPSDEKQQNENDENQKNSIINAVLNDNSSDGSAVDESVDDSCSPPASKDVTTPVPSPYADFQSDSPESDYFGGDECWDKSLENEYNNVLYKTISKLASKPRTTNIRDKFNTRLLARRSSKIERKHRFRRRRQFNETKLRVGDEFETGGLAAVVGEMPPTAVLRLDVLAEKTSPRCKIKVQLPWGRIFNLKSPRPKDQRNREEVYNDTKLELGPARVKVRLSRSPGEWQVATRCQSDQQPKSTVVSVRRLVLQRAASPVTSDRCDQSFGNSPQQEERSRKLPKIVIRRNEQDNNYTSYVSTCNGVEFEEGDDSTSDHGEDAPRLIVRLVRDRKLDAMAADGITKLNLTQLVPNPVAVAAAAATSTTTSTTTTTAVVVKEEVEEDEDDDDDTTHSAKRVRYT